MSLKKVHDDQPNEFNFSLENLKLTEDILKKYPEKNKKSAVMPLLYLAQKQNQNWIPLAAIKYIAKYLSMPYISVYEVATFYTMYNLAPVGKHFIQVCTTTPCLIRGADKIVKICKEKISPKEGDAFEAVIDSVNKMGAIAFVKYDDITTLQESPLIIILPNEYFNDSTYQLNDMNKGHKLKVEIVAVRIKFRSEQIHVVAKPV